VTEGTNFVHANGPGGALSDLLHAGGPGGGQVLRGIAAWDGEREIGVVDIAWQDGQIAAITPAQPDPAARDLTVIPGLIDTHVHLLGYAGPLGAPGAPDTFTWPLVTTREEQVLHAAANAQRALRAGITTLRDLAADTAQAALSRVFDAGIVTGPRVLASGPVGMTAGHLDLFTPAAVRDRPPVADGPDACRALVRRWARDGLSGIKIYTSGGVLSQGDKPAWRNHTPAEIAATVDEAHALGMRVAAHAHSADGIAVALQHGVDSIEHATEMTAEQAEELAARRIPVAPTLLINEIIASGRPGAAPESVRKAAALVAARDERFAAAAAAGVRFVLGTDASGYFVTFDGAWAEMRRMAEVLRWDAARTLRAATSEAADALGLSSVTGRLAPGRSADLVVVRGRPQDDPEAWHSERVVAVVSRGRLVASALPDAGPLLRPADCA
jgi:imidazolonepropionase-like amidohydrolase